MSSTRKYSGETNWYASFVLTLPVSPKAARCPNSGHDAATAATEGSAVTAFTIASRVCSFTIWTATVSEVRTPVSCEAPANALLKNTAAEINSSADALTCRPIRKFRARPGRASLTTSPRIVRIGSMRVACSAGASANAMVETTAPARINSSTRQSASGISNRTSPISGGMLVISALTITASATREIRKPAAAAISASSRLSVISWRTMRRRVAPSDNWMPISRCRATALARRRLATFAQPISRMRPNAKNKGPVTGTASRGCGTIPRLGTSMMREPPCSVGLLPLVWAASQAASCAAPTSRDRPGFRRPMMSRPTVASRPLCIGLT